jgi:methylenetetrahydrofolate dehydrogenase (NADP+)/methenyltetrahydrofolate cyclohydrolase
MRRSRNVVRAEVIDGKAVAAGVRKRVATEVAELRSAGVEPGLATVLVGDDPASHVYVRNKRKACAEVGIASIHHELDASTSEDELRALLESLNADTAVSGILLQLPLPEGLPPDEMTGLIAPAKDVDGLTPISAGLLAQGRPGLVPCTPAGIMELLAHAGVELTGASAVVIGRSQLVGKPVAQLLLAANATVTQCHSRTRDLAEVCRGADVLIAAVGRPGTVTADMVREGAVVIDVGTNRTDDGLVGDVDFDAVAAKAGAITPVPGGVGPMTIAMLLSNTARAARLDRLRRDGSEEAANG